MKKLMIAALVAAMGGVAMAADCGELKCPFVYRIKLAGKTVVGRSTESNKVTCTDGKCYQKPASYRLAGYFAGNTEGGGDCGQSCVCFEPLSTTGSIFWDGNHRYVAITPELKIAEVLRNGGAKNKMQILFNLKEDGDTGDGLYLAGFGAFNPLTGNLKNANGFFAGTVAIKSCQTYGDCGEVSDPVEPLVWTPCASAVYAKDADPIASVGAIAYGRWNMAYKADKVALAQKLVKTGAATPENVWYVPGLVIPSDITGLPTK